MRQNDRNAKEIVAALRKAGAACEYWVPSARQKGLPDIVVGYGGITYLLEIKAPGGTLSDGQKAFHAAWRGGPIATVRTVVEAFVAIGVELPF